MNQQELEERIKALTAFLEMESEGEMRETFNTQDLFIETLSTYNENLSKLENYLMKQKLELLEYFQQYEEAMFERKKLMEKMTEILSIIPEAVPEEQTNNDDNN